MKLILLFESQRPGRKEIKGCFVYRLEDGKSVLWELKHERSELL